MAAAFDSSRVKGEGRWCPPVLPLLNEMAENGADCELPSGQGTAQQAVCRLLVAEGEEAEGPTGSGGYGDKDILSSLLVLVTLFSIAYSVEGKHQKYVQHMEKRFLWCAYWVGLGILSSVGLGTGLHTFLLYLGPHIARRSCWGRRRSAGAAAAAVQGGFSLWTIVSKVRLEACMWGAGTAIGELPPYFMAQAARLSGADPDDEDYEEFGELLEQAEAPQDFATRAKLAVQKMVQRVGFFGILACASIPNPLFDLAVITWPFPSPFLDLFWSNVNWESHSQYAHSDSGVGSSIIEPIRSGVPWADDFLHIQAGSEKLLVIVTFSRHIVEQMVSLIGAVPVLGASLQKPFREYLEAQRAKMHHRTGEGTPANENWLSWVFEKVIVVMVCFFVCPIVNSMAQSYAKRQQQQKYYEGKTK
ncbi:hypothetical protein J4Q44_G00071960 [Coregonus suidteri]|uniref:Vacuole membrane protein 1 n=1 Tax=Coregonus suidteri TaxID=861788 RepID=A0AAN8M570_9TELE